MSKEADVFDKLVSDILSLNEYDNAISLVNSERIEDITSVETGFPDYIPIVKSVEIDSVNPYHTLFKFKLVTVELNPARTLLDSTSIPAFIERAHDNDGNFITFERTIYDFRYLRWKSLQWALMSIVRKEQYPYTIDTILIPDQTWCTKLDYNDPSDGGYFPFTNKVYIYLKLQ